MTTPHSYPPPVAAFLERLAHTPARELLAVVEQADGIGVTRALAAAETAARAHDRYDLLCFARDAARRIIDNLRLLALAQGIRLEDVAVLGLLAEWAVTGLLVRDLLSAAHVGDLTHAWEELLPNLETQ